MAKDRPMLDRMRFRETMILLEDGNPSANDGRLAAGRLRGPGRWPVRHVYRERPRGHSKTGDLGTEAVTELILGRRGTTILGSRRTKVKAGLLRIGRQREIRPGTRPSRSLVKIMRRRSSSERPAPGRRCWQPMPRPPMVCDRTGSRLTNGRVEEAGPSCAGFRIWTATGKRPGAECMVISTCGWDKAGISPGKCEPTPARA